MVTASDGNPKRVTNRPLSAPSAAPSSRQIPISSGSEETPQTQSWPSTTQVRPSMLATDRSISPVMTTSVSGSAMSRIGIASSVTNRQNLGLATPSMVSAPITATRTSASITTASHDISADRSRVFHSVMGTPAAQAPADPKSECPVESDRGEDQSADGRALPERIDPEYRQRAADRGEQYGPDRGAVHRSAAAEDGHPADDDGGDHVELGAEAGVGVEGAEPGRVQHPGETGQHAAGDECGKHPLTDRDAGQPGRDRVGSDRLQLPAAAVGAQVVPGHDDNGRREQGQYRNPEHGLGA